MKKLWARIGMTVCLTDEEAKEALDLLKVYDDFNWTNCPKWLVEKFRAEGVIDGECYVPEPCIEELEEALK